MLCPYCKLSERVIKKGFEWRKCAQNGRQRRFFCRSCCRYFSETTATLVAGQRRPELNSPIYHLLVSGVSQRRIARLLRTTQATVARKMVRIAAFAETFVVKDNMRLAGTVATAVFDEMETFEHSRLKPLSIALAVDEQTRRIIGVGVASMPAKGHLAKAARQRYGYRPDHRQRGLAEVLRQVQVVRKDPHFLVKSDQCPRYPTAVRKHLPGAAHIAFKGRRACVVGLGEMKIGGFDPLFALNHTCAMNRDNLKRLSRRTWCTTKRPDRLRCLLWLYATAHNDHIAQTVRRDRSMTFFDIVQASTRTAPHPPTKLTEGAVKAEESA